MLFIAITIILIAILILYLLILKSSPKPVYYPMEVPTKDSNSKKTVEEQHAPTLTEKEKMFQTYFPKVEKGIEMDYPLKPIGCCPPSKEMSKDLPIANIPICYAKDSKPYLR